MAIQITWREKARKSNSQEKSATYLPGGVIRSYEFYYLTSVVCDAMRCHAAVDLTIDVLFIGVLIISKGIILTWLIAIRLCNLSDRLSVNHRDAPRVMRLTEAVYLSQSARVWC